MFAKSIQNFAAKISFSLQRKMHHKRVVHESTKSLADCEKAEEDCTAFKKLKVSIK